ncbi:hypothetical protein T4B_6843 [Trichinella pseudospiralis]|uniref:Uncharacterized protein n=1 Tax=Trichinella pseudospiralis TaxID=6337 RepID=A0A0V1KCN9_TRIPS|nr:hypothetical protein T4B_6843 [Trichinella pseudospiralis]KRZ44972.1 hypothetical protein T4C_4464 [Trichinella pseudospiralis]
MAKQIDQHHFLILSQEFPEVSKPSFCSVEIFPCCESKHSLEIKIVVRSLENKLVNKTHRNQMQILYKNVKYLLVLTGCSC